MHTPQARPWWQRLFTLAARAAALLAVAAAGAQAATGNVGFVSGSSSVTPSGTSASVRIAGIRNLTSNTTSGTLQFRLVYTSTPYNGGTINGYTLFTVPFSSISGCGTGVGQLAPGVSCTNITIPSTSFTLPPAGTYYPVLLVLEYSSSCSTTYCISDYIALNNTSTGGSTVTIGGSGGGGGGGGGSTGNVEFVSGSSSVTPSGTTASVRIAGIRNPSSSTTSGTLQFRLVYSSTRYSGGTLNGYTLFTVPFSSVSGCGTGAGQLAPLSSCTNITIPATSYTQPPAGTYYPVLVVLEYSSSCSTTYCISDYIELDNSTTGGPTVTVGSSGGGGGGGGGGGSGGGAGFIGGNVTVAGGWTVQTTGFADATQVTLLAAVRNITSTTTSGSWRVEMALSDTPDPSRSTRLYVLNPTSNNNGSPLAAGSSTSTQSYSFSFNGPAGVYYPILYLREYAGPSACPAAGDGYCYNYSLAATSVQLSARPAGGGSAGGDEGGAALGAAEVLAAGLGGLAALLRAGWLRWRRRATA